MTHSFPTRRSSDLPWFVVHDPVIGDRPREPKPQRARHRRFGPARVGRGVEARVAPHDRSEEHTSELQSLMRSSYAVFCLKKQNNRRHTSNDTIQDLIYYNTAIEKKAISTET